MFLTLGQLCFDLSYDRGRKVHALLSTCVCPADNLAFVRRKSVLVHQFPIMGGVWPTHVFAKQGVDLAVCVREDDFAFFEGINLVDDSQRLARPCCEEIGILALEEAAERRTFDQLPGRHVDFHELSDVWRPDANVPRPHMYDVTDSVLVTQRFPTHESLLDRLSRRKCGLGHRHERAVPQQAYSKTVTHFGGVRSPPFYGSSTLPTAREWPAIATNFVSLAASR